MFYFSPLGIPGGTYMRISQVHWHIDIDTGSLRFCIHQCLHSWACHCLAHILDCTDRWMNQECCSTAEHIDCWHHIHLYLRRYSCLLPIETQDCTGNKMSLVYSRIFGGNMEGWYIHLCLRTAPLASDIQEGTDMQRIPVNWCTLGLLYSCASLQCTRLCLSETRNTERIVSCEDVDISSLLPLLKLNFYFILKSL